MLKPIKTEKQYNTVLARIYDLMQMDIKKGSKLGDELEVLALLAEDYGNKHYPIPPPHPIEAIKFRLDQMGIDEKELSKVLGGKSRKSEILNGKRKLSLNMIRRLHTQFDIPAEILIAAY